MPPDDARACPWCGRWALKDGGCNWVACGLANDGAAHQGFQVGAGCGRSWCFACGKKLCSLVYDPASGARVGREAHDAACCRTEPGFTEADYCPGGHNAHAPPRWASR